MCAGGICFPVSYIFCFLMAMAMQTAAPPQVTPRPMTSMMMADVVIVYLLFWVRLWAWKIKLNTTIPTTSSQPK